MSISSITCTFKSNFVLTPPLASLLGGVGTTESDLCSISLCLMLEYTLTKCTSSMDCTWLRESVTRICLRLSFDVDFFISYCGGTSWDRLPRGVSGGKSCRPAKTPLLYLNFYRLPDDSYSGWLSGEVEFCPGAPPTLWNS